MHFRTEESLKALSDKFFHEHGRTKISTTFTVEDLYQAIKARLQTELIANGHANEGVVFARLENR